MEQLKSFEGVEKLWQEVNLSNFLQNYDRIDLHISTGGS